MISSSNCCYQQDFADILLEYEITTIAQKHYNQCSLQKIMWLLANIFNSKKHYDKYKMIFSFFKLEETFS